MAALLSGGGCTPSFAQADPSDGVAINGTYTVFSDGQWAQTDQSYHDEASVTQTWTITSACSAFQDCTGRVPSDQGWSGDLMYMSGRWKVTRTVPDWERHLRRRRARRPAGSRDAMWTSHFRQAAQPNSRIYPERNRRGREAGGRWTERPEGLDKGFYVKPTLFDDVDNSMTIAQEEIFGPVLVVIPFEDEDDAVRIANDSPYGLAGNVMSGSLDHAFAVAKRLRAGFLGVNGAAGYGADTPFGGYKASGVGRQNGIAGFDQYTEIKSVAYPADER